MMMDSNISWFDPSNEKLPDFVYRAVRSKAEIMEKEEAFLGSLDPQGLIWDYREAGEDFLQQQEEIFLAAYSGKANSSHQLLPLPLTTSSSSAMGALKNLETFNPSCCETSSSGLSQTYPDSFCNQRAETEHRHCSIPKLAERKRDDSHNPSKLKKAKLDHPEPASISFGREDGDEADCEAIAQVKEIIYIAAALRPVAFNFEEAVQKPRRKNLKISNDPQTAAARHRRERISDRLRMLQMLVPGGRKMDTASMLDEAANYLKFLKAQVTAFEKLGHGDSSFGHLKGAAAAASSLNCGHGMLPFPVALSFYSSPNQTCIFPLQNT